MTDPHTFISFQISLTTHERMRKLMGQCGVTSIEHLFEQMIDELDWQINMSSPVKAALLASRAISKAAALGNDSQEDNPRTGVEPDKQQ